ncbi:hypothetical protein F5Y17DRAFT_460404 [Xylariaceae sp. FL0594]|nr:hypothetical protein F5Y17DRAFT_460404 [Xylariaceae sp. FL0594]
MCIRRISHYPCGHIKTSFDLCAKARATNLLLPSSKNKANTPCDGKHQTIKLEVPDLQDTCGSACLTRPWKCSRCPSTRRNLGWTCSDCGGLRDKNVKTWCACACPAHRPIACPENVLGGGVCAGCRTRCAR